MEGRWKAENVDRSHLASNTSQAALHVDMNSTSNRFKYQQGRLYASVWWSDDRYHIFWRLTTVSRQGTIVSRILSLSAQCWEWFHRCICLPSFSARECLLHPSGESGEKVISHLAAFMQTLYIWLLTTIREPVPVTSSLRSEPAENLQRLSGSCKPFLYK